MVRQMQGERLRRAMVWLSVGVWSVVLLGCAGQRSLVESAGFWTVGAEPHVQSQLVSPVGARRHIVAPFFPDDTDQCGPATLASVLTYWGIQTDPRALKEEIYLPRLKGTLPIDLLLAAQARDLKAEIYQGSLGNLKSELDEGHPLVALLDLGFAIFPQGHYVVVTGYDDQRQGVYVHSSLEKDVFIPYEQFLHSWERTGRWTLLVEPPVGHVRGQA